MPMPHPPGLVMHDRDGVVSPDSPFEKLVLLPKQTSTDPCEHAYCDGRFAVDIMAEHALFFTILMPPELAPNERQQAQQFNTKFTDLLKKIDANGVPTPQTLKNFCTTITDAIKPFADYKGKLYDASTSGTFRSLVWPLFFEHTLDEADRWVERLTQLSTGDATFARSTVVRFWAEIMDEHAQFHAHLMDPCEKQRIEAMLRTSADFAAVENMCNSPSGCPRPVTGQADPVMNLAKSALDMEVANVLGVEAAEIRSIIDPRLADHTRRETLKFVDELQRAT